MDLETVQQWIVSVALMAPEWLLANLPGWLATSLVTAYGGTLAWIAGRFVGLGVRLSVAMGKAGVRGLTGAGKWVGQRTGLTAWLRRPSAAQLAYETRMGEMKADHDILRHQLQDLMGRLGETAQAMNAPDGVAKTYTHGEVFGKEGRHPRG
jgi:hypothetical protein